MLRRLKHSRHTYYGYRECFGPFRGIRCYLASHRWPLLTSETAGIKIPNSDTLLYLRLGTSDIDVFNGIYKNDEYGWDFTNPPRVIIDAGAYTGLSTSFFAMKYPNAKIIAIEPDESNFELLAMNTAAFSNVTIVRAALWAESGSVYLTDPGLGAWGIRLQAEHEATHSRQSTPSLTIEELARRYSLDRIDLLKIDIEGSEKEVFASSSPWIDRVEAICLELHDRFKSGCSREFFKAIDDFPIELWHSEDVLVLREGSRLGSLVMPASK